MINEIYKLQKVISESGINLISWHNHYKSCPNTLGYLLFLNEKSEIAYIKEIELINMKKYRKFERANGISFPSFKITPMCFLNDDNLKNQLYELYDQFDNSNISNYNFIKKINKIIRNCSDTAKKSYKRINNCLNKATSELLELIDCQDKLSFPIIELINRVKNIDAVMFYNLIKYYLIKNSIKNGYIDKKLFGSLLFTENANSSLAVVLELYDYKNFEYTVNHKKVQHFINKCLIENFKDKNTSVIGQDAFNNNLSESDLEEPYPTINIPEFGLVKLRSLNGNASPCQRRYNITGSGTFHCSYFNQQKMKDALEWITRSEVKNKTWCVLNNICNFDKVIFIAYPTKLTNTPPELSSLCIKSDYDNDVKFEKITENVISSLRGIKNDSISLNINIMALAKINYSTKLIFNAQFSDQNICNSALTWIEACKNVPEITFHLNKEEYLELNTLFPNMVLDFLNKKITHNGNNINQIHTKFSINDAINLLLSNDSKKLSKKMLYCITNNWEQFFVKLGSLHTKKDIKFLKKYKYYIQHIPSLIGLLLYKLNYKKGDFVMEAPFLIGKIIACADIIHFEYCKYKRNNTYPSKFIGNKFINEIVKKPKKELNNFFKRLTIYINWVKVSNSEEVKRSKYILKILNDCMKNLSNTTIPNEFNIEEINQLYMGYYSSI